MHSLYRKKWQNFAFAEERGQTNNGREEAEEGAAARNLQPVQRLEAEAATIEAASSSQRHDHAGTASVLRSNGQGGLEEKEMKYDVYAYLLFILTI